MRNSSELTQPPTTFPFIGALRGIAALLAAYFHTMMFGVHNLTMSDADLSIQSTLQVFGPPFGYLDFGKIGIAIFFIVSGFLIPHTLNKSDATINQFVAKRVFRLYPAYWVSIALLWAVKLAFNIYPEVTVPNTLVNLTMFQKFVGVADINGVFWTLQIELIFYVICGLLFLTKQLHRRTEMLYLSLLAALLCATLRYLTGRNLPVALFLALTLMWWGDLLRQVIKDPARHTKVAIYSVVIILLMLGPICWLAYRDLAIRYFLSYVVATVTFGMTFLLKTIFARTNLLNRVLNFLGDISYGVYLIHAITSVELARGLTQLGYSAEVALLSGIALTILLSFVIYVGVEQPFIKIGHQVARSFKR